MSLDRKLIIFVVLSAYIMSAAVTTARSSRARATLSPRDFCRKYVFAPRCRGVANKRDLQKLEPLLEAPRYSQESLQDYRNGYQNNRQWQDNDSSNKRLLETLVTKLNPRNLDYDSGTDDYFQ